MAKCKDIDMRCIKSNSTTLLGFTAAEAEGYCMKIFELLDK